MVNSSRLDSDLNFISASFPKVYSKLDFLGGPTILTSPWWAIYSHSWDSVQFSRSVMSDSLRPMNHSTPGLPVHHQLPESTQTHVHPVSDAIQTSHPLSSPSPPALSPSQHQCLFQWVSSSHQVAKVLESQLQHWSSQWTLRTDFL